MAKLCKMRVSPICLFVDGGARPISAMAHCSLDAASRSERLRLRRWLGPRPADRQVFREGDQGRGPDRAGDQGGRPSCGRDQGRGPGRDRDQGGDLEKSLPGFYSGTFCSYGPPI